MPSWVTWSHFFPNLVLFVFDYSVVSALLNSNEKAGPDMNVRKKIAEERGQGLVEYTLIVLFVALVLWLGVKSTNAGDVLTSHWNAITDCAGSPFSCSSGS